MSEYHRTLGVKPGASKGEIKKAYRKKALRLHPDRNPDPKAHEEFIRATEAYDALLEGKIPKQKTSSHSSNEESTFNSKRYGRTMTKEEYEEKMKWAKEYARTRAQMQAEAVERDYQYMIKSFAYKISHAVATLSVLTLVLISIDLASEPVTSAAQITGVHRSGGRTEITYIYISDEAGLAGSFGSTTCDASALLFKKGDLIAVNQTRLFKEVNSIIVLWDKSRDIYMSYKVPSIYRASFFIYLVLLLPGLNYLIRKRSPAYYFLLHVNSVLAPIMMIVVWIWLL